MCPTRELCRLLRAVDTKRAWERTNGGRHPEPDPELLRHKHLDSTQRYARVNAYQLHGSIKRPRWAA